MRPAYAVLCAILALMVAVSSVTSAVAMAPDRDDMAAAAFAQVFGPIDGGICGDLGDHDHHCPFCHAVPDTPRITPTGLMFVMRPHDGWRQHRDLHRAAQARNSSHSPRAPPVSV